MIEALNKESGLLLTHLHPALCAMKPPQRGPRTGPKRGPAPNIDMAIPRCSGSNKSDTTPPPIVKHAEPPIPVRTLKHINAERFGASAQPTWKRTKKEVEILRMILRPYISLNGDRNNGPTLENLSGNQLLYIDVGFCSHRSQTDRMSHQGNPE